MGRLVAVGAIVAAAAFALILISGSDEPEPSAGSGAATDCIARWNDDPLALQTGVHAYRGHEYSAVQVISGSQRQGGDPNDPANYTCTIVFPAASPDPEPEAAAMVLIPPSWNPLSSLGGVRNERLGELQAIALTSENAALNPDGTIAGL